MPELQPSTPIHTLTDLQYLHDPAQQFKKLYLESLEHQLSNDTNNLPHALDGPNHIAVALRWYRVESLFALSKAHLREYRISK